MIVLARELDPDLGSLLSCIYLSVGLASLVGPSLYYTVLYCTVLYCTALQVGPSLVGLVLDTTASYSLAFLLVSGLFTLGALCLPASWLLHSRDLRKKTKPQDL